MSDPARYDSDFLSEEMYNHDLPSELCCVSAAEMDCLHARAHILRADSMLRNAAMHEYHLQGHGAALPSEYLHDGFYNTYDGNHSVWYDAPACDTWYERAPADNYGSLASPKSGTLTGSVVPTSTRPVVYMEPVSPYPRCSPMVSHHDGKACLPEPLMQSLVHSPTSNSSANTYPHQMQPLSGGVDCYDSPYYPKQDAHELQPCPQYTAPVASHHSYDDGDGCIASAFRLFQESTYPYMPPDLSDMTEEHTYKQETLSEPLEKVHRSASASPTFPAVKGVVRKSSRRTQRSACVLDVLKDLADDENKRRSSRFRGVTKHRRSGRWEAHIWVKEIGRQVYLGGYENEEHAAEAYDVAALKCKGKKVKTNFEVSRYQDLLDCMDSISLEELIMAVRRQSQGFSRGSSTYRGVTAHPSGRWESRIGIPGSKHIYLGLYEDEKDAAKAYDRALVRLRGTAAATNFSLSEYKKELADYHQMQQEVLVGNQKVERLMQTGPDFEKWIKMGRRGVGPGTLPSAKVVEEEVEGLLQSPK